MGKGRAARSNGRLPGFAGEISAEMLLLRRNVGLLGLACGLLLVRLPEQDGQHGGHRKGDDKAGHDHGAVVHRVFTAHEHAEAEEGRAADDVGFQVEGGSKGTAAGAADGSEQERLAQRHVDAVNDRLGDAGAGGKAGGSGVALQGLSRVLSQTPKAAPAWPMLAAPEVGET